MFRKFCNISRKNCFISGSITVISYLIVAIYLAFVERSLWIWGSTVEWKHLLSCWFIDLKCHESTADSSKNTGGKDALVIYLGVEMGAMPRLINDVGWVGIDSERHMTSRDIRFGIDNVAYSNQVHLYSPNERERKEKSPNLSFFINRPNYSTIHNTPKFPTSRNLTITRKLKILGNPRL
jgi:hypothetical protein